MTLLTLSHFSNAFPTPHKFSSVTQPGVEGSPFPESLPRSLLSLGTSALEADPTLLALVWTLRQLSGLSQDNASLSFIVFLFYIPLNFSFLTMGHLAE